MNSQLIDYFINKGFYIFYPSGFDDTKVILLAHAASHMLAASPLVKVFYQHLIHVTDMLSTWPE
jgi:hypothetical protein